MDDDEVVVMSERGRRRNAMMDCHDHSPRWLEIIRAPIYMYMIVFLPSFSCPLMTTDNSRNGIRF